MDSIASRSAIIYAVMLRDIRTRFGGTQVGYLIAISWPLFHLSALVIINWFVRTSAPIGGDNAVFIATGVAPYVLCLYPARMMSGAIDANRQLFGFPIVRPFDIIVARIIIEFLTAFIVLIIFFLGASLVGINLLPHNMAVAATAILATVYLSVCMGLVNIGMVALTPFWHVGFALIMIVVYISAGIFILPQYLSSNIVYWMSWNPLFHAVEWLRSAYYQGYGDGQLSKSYMLTFATCQLALGLFGERFIRGRFLSGP